MRTLVLLTGILFFCLALALAAAAAYSWVNSPATEAARAAEVAYQVQRAKMDLETWQAVQPFVIVALAVTILSIPGLLVAGALGVAWLVKRRVELVRPDRRGLLPMDRARLQAGAYDQHAALALAGFHLAENTRAANPPPAPLPAPVAGSRVVYAPRYGAAPAPPAPRLADGQTGKFAPALPAGVNVPKFADLLAGGMVGHIGALLLGYSADPNGGGMTPVIDRPGSVYSIALAGASGSGKTTTARFLLGQAALQGALLFVIDPHRDVAAGDESLAAALAPLAPALLAPPAAAPDEIGAVLGQVDRLIDAREAGEQGPVVYIAVDEWTELMDMGGAEELTRVIRRVCVAGRKLGVYAVVCGQDWTKESAGSIRDVLTGAYVHKLRPNVARLIAPNCPRDVWEMEPGQAYLDLARGPRRRVAVPLTTGQDLAAVAARLPAPRPVPSPNWGTTVPAPPSAIVTPRPGGGADDGMSWDPSPVGPGRTVDGGRSDGKNEGENGQITDRPRPTAHDRPPLRVVRPLPLVEKARAAGMEFSESEWRDLMMMDAGQTPQAIAAKDTGTTEGRPYRRRRDDLVKLADLVRGWPDGETWDAAAAAEDLEGNR